MTDQMPAVNQSFGKAFGAGLALALLTVYTTAAMAMILAILEACPDTPDCATLSDKYSHGYIYVLTTVGGLVSALVVGQLGAAHPGELPGAAQRAGRSRIRRIASGTVISIYLIVWAGVGFTSLIVGVMLYPDAISTVSDMGTVWLGLAVSAGYAYFGIDTRR